jgi:hypothetical protein
MVWLIRSRKSIANQNGLAVSERWIIRRTPSNQRDTDKRIFLMKDLAAIEKAVYIAAKIAQEKVAFLMLN